MEVLVDARGKACPLPVIETRNALREHGAPVVTLVDNDIARQNVEKMARQMGLNAATQQAEGGWRITLTAAEQGFDPDSQEVEDLMENIPPCIVPVQGPTVVVLSSDQMGTGDEVLGRALSTPSPSWMRPRTPYFCTTAAPSCPWRGQRRWRT